MDQGQWVGGFGAAHPYTRQLMVLPHRSFVGLHWIILVKTSCTLPIETGYHVLLPAILWPLSVYRGPVATATRLATKLVGRLYHELLPNPLPIYKYIIIYLMLLSRDIFVHLTKTSFIIIMLMKLLRGMTIIESNLTQITVPQSRFAHVAHFQWQMMSRPTFDG